MSDRWQYEVHEVKASVMGGIRRAAIEEQSQKPGVQGLVSAVHATTLGPTLLFLKRPG